MDIRHVSKLGQLVQLSKQLSECCSQLHGSLVRVSDRTDPFYGKLCWITDVEHSEMGVWVTVQPVDVDLTGPFHYSLEQFELEQTSTGRLH